MEERKNKQKRKKPSKSWKVRKTEQKEEEKKLFGQFN